MLLVSGLAFFMAATSVAGEPTTATRPHVELKIGYQVVDRQIQPLSPDELLIEGDTVTAWSALAGVPAGFVEHVWSRDGVEVARHYLPVGTGRRWRTWSRQRVKAGSYEVRVIGPDGTSLATTRFEVASDDGGC
jgi:hypothetical protein